MKKERIKATTRLSDALSLAVNSGLISRPTKFSQLRSLWAQQMPAVVRAKVQLDSIDDETLHLKVLTTLSPSESDTANAWLAKQGPRYGLRDYRFTAPTEDSGDGLVHAIESSASARSKTAFIDDVKLRQAFATLITQVEIREKRQ